MFAKQAKHLAGVDFLFSHHLPANMFFRGLGIGIRYRELLLRGESVQCHLAACQCELFPARGVELDLDQSNVWSEEGSCDHEV